MLIVNKTRIKQLIIIPKAIIANIHTSAVSTQAFMKGSQQNGVV